MDGLIQPGDTLRMERAGALLTAEKRIGEGSQGVVHVARLNGTPFAVKWLRPGPGSDEMRASITALIQRGRPPHPAFIWPIDLVSSGRTPGFGYVMPLLDPRFVSLAQVLNQDRQPSFRVITTIARELVDVFAALHSAGLCYRDISFGNLRVDVTPAPPVPSDKAWMPLPRRNNDMNEASTPYPPRPAGSAGLFSAGGDRGTAGHRAMG